MSWPAKATVSMIQATERPMSRPAATSVTMIAVSWYMPSGSTAGAGTTGAITRDSSTTRATLSMSGTRVWPNPGMVARRPVMRTRVSIQISSLTWVKAQVAGLSSGEPISSAGRRPN